MRISVIGLGKMGHALAGRLLDGGHDLTVWNRSGGKADDLVAAGAAAAPTPAAAAAAGEAVFLSLSDDAAVRALLAGGDGVAAALGPGAVLVDTSTVSPSTSLETAALVGGRHLAAPILGAPSAVAAGQAAYLVGGPKPCFDQLAPAFATLADEGRARYVGADPAVALTLKLLSNYLLMSGIAALSEAVATAQAAGLGDELIGQYFRQAPLVAPALHNRLDDIVSGDHTGWFTTALGAKDVRLAAELAASFGLSLPLAEVVRRRYEEAAAAGFEESDIGAVVELLRRRGPPPAQ